uniref:Uncharacterized protein n=1 Tax=Mizugakiibacter sediminis TaxID=1475481 RepID=A0A0U1PAU1_9GAMM
MVEVAAQAGVDDQAAAGDAARQRDAAARRLRLGAIEAVGGAVRQAQPALHALVGQGGDAGGAGGLGHPGHANMRVPRSAARGLARAAGIRYSSAPFVLTFKCLERQRFSR